MKIKHVRLQKPVATPGRHSDMNEYFSDETCNFRLEPTFLVLICKVDSTKPEVWTPLHNVTLMVVEPEGPRVTKSRSAADSAVP